jgi:hypothetical protein
MKGAGATTTRAADAEESSGLFGGLLVGVDASVATIAAEGADGSDAASELLGNAAALGAMNISAAADGTLVAANLVKQLHMAMKGDILFPQAVNT